MLQVTLLWIKGLVGLMTALGALVVGYTIYDLLDDNHFYVIMIIAFIIVPIAIGVIVEACERQIRKHRRKQL